MTDYGFSMDPWWKFGDPASKERLQAAVDGSGGVRGLWEEGTAGMDEFGFFQSEISESGDVKRELPNLQVTFNLEIKSEEEGRDSV